MRFIDNDEFGAFEFEVGGAAVGLDEVGGDDNERVPVEHRDADWQVAFQALDGAAKDEFGVDMELFGKFLLPLFGQVGRAEHGHALDFAAIQQFAGDEHALYRFANPHVIGNEQANGIELEGHHERHKLVRPGLDGNAGEAAERAGGRASGEPGRLAQQATGAEVAQVGDRGQRERGRLHGLDGRHDANDLFIEAADRPGQQQICGGVGEDHPFAAPGPDECAWLGKQG